MLRNLSKIRGLTGSPSFYLKMSLFIPKGQGGDKFSLIGYAGNNSELSHYQFAGLSYALKRRQGARLIHLLEIEAFSRFSNNKNVLVEVNHNDETHDPLFELASKKQLGSYINYAYGFNTRVSLGVRADYFKLFNADSDDYSNASADLFGITPHLTWRHSEFFRARLSLSANKNFINGKAEGEDYRASLQATFFLGNHPSHDF